MPTPLRSLRLHAADLAVLTQELTRLRGLLLGFQQDVTAAAAIEPRTAASTRQMEALRNSDLAVVETHQRLLEFLSSDGRAKFRAYVDGEKRNMRALGPAPAPSPSGQ